MRFLTLFLAAMFFANNATAAVRACVADLARSQHLAVRTLVAEANKRPCPPSEDAGPCLTHYTQTYQIDEQQAWADFTPLAPVAAPLHASFQPKPKRVVLASAPPIVGPPLTILFGNFRNYTDCSRPSPERSKASRRTGASHGWPS
jgi:hypothetical protein